ncbi:MAG: hypothetical protein D6761_04375 [Candidatus Dadabacteria bacterium]|nr:MAG: hypothetical protein D6761_04375 [Candidatus Dadabacteria bacterium]
MRFTDGTSFPHPVLSSTTSDFSDAEFSADLTVAEDMKTGALDVRYSVNVSEPTIAKFLEQGVAALGLFVECLDTFHLELRRISWPVGTTDFAAGKLLNRVSIRPLIWMESSIPNWEPPTIHPEFEMPIAINRGAIIAIGDEFVISVGQAKLAPVESIFELDSSPDVPPGTITVDLERDRITILTDKATHQTILTLRGQASGKELLLNAVYLPVVMEVLDALRDGDQAYRAHRWYNPFMARCDAKGIDPTAQLPLMEAAQKLLDLPAQKLEQIAKGMT